jgi:hypothetical protein
MPSTQSKKRAVDTWQPLWKFYHVSVIVNVIAMLCQQSHTATPCNEN